MRLLTWAPDGRGKTKRAINRSHRNLAEGIESRLPCESYKNTLKYALQKLGGITCSAVFK